MPEPAGMHAIRIRRVEVKRNSTAPEKALKRNATLPSVPVIGTHPSACTMSIGSEADWAILAAVDPNIAKHCRRDIILCTLLYGLGLFDWLVTSIR
jgi:hypothetical protein